MEEVKFTEKANALVDVLKSYVRGKISRNEFEIKFPPVLAEYESVIKDSAYSPLGELVPSENQNTEWLENMIAMYQNEIENLEKQKRNPEKPYAHTLSKEKYNQLCKEGLGQLQIEISDRKTKMWVETNLINDEEIEFLDKNGTSKFGNFKTLYRCDLLHESFLVTALNGGIPRLQKTIEEILKKIEIENNGAPAVWVRCYDADGFALVENCYNIQSSYENLDVIQWFELTTSSSTQGEGCNLLLLPENKEWMFSLSNDFKSFEMTIHGKKEFVESIVRYLS